jgi:hypothetical protein
VLVREVVEFGKSHLGVQRVEEFETVREDVNFSLPAELKGLLEAKRPDPA